MKYVLAVDCGGSKISCLAVDYSGRLLGTAKSGSDGLLLGEASDLKVYEQAVNGAVGGLNAKCSAVFCSTGGFPPDGLGELLSNLTGTEKVKVVREAGGELIAANAPLWNFDVAVMAGTGSVAVGVTAEIISVGGWGWIIDDRGSGFALGRDALRAATAYADGKCRISGFIADVLEAEAISADIRREDVRYLLKRLLPGLDRQKVASLAPLLVNNAAKGDPAALKSVDEATDYLAGLALLAAKRLTLKKVRVTGIGGLFAQEGFFRKSFADKISKHGMEAVFNGFDLLKGAAVCALIEAGTEIIPEIIENIRENINA